MSNEVYDTGTSQWVKQEGTSTGQTEVVVTASAAGEELAIKARQPVLIDAPPLGDTFATPTRQVGPVDVVIVSAPAQAAAVDPGSGSGVPVRTTLDDMTEGTPSRLRASLGLGALGEGAPGHLGTAAYPVSVHGADTEGGLQQLALDHTREDDFGSIRLTDGVNFYAAAKTEQVPASLGTKTAAASLSITHATDPTFYAVFDRIVPAANKYMATLFNTSATRIARVHRLWVYNWQVGAVTGVVLDQELRRISARTAGVSVTPVAGDTIDALSAGIGADAGSTAVTEVAGAMYQRIIAYNEEATLAQGYVTGRVQNAGALQYERLPGTRGIVLRENEGITVKNITSSTVGSVSYVFEFTDEAA